MNWGNMVEIIISFEVLEMENLKEYGYNDEYKLMERFNFLFCMGMDDFGELRFSCGDENVEMDFFRFFVFSILRLVIIFIMFF